jgi:hypothetical protein
VTGPDGRYTLPPLAPGDAVVELSLSGYTRALRHVSITEHAGAHVHDARLTPLNPASEIGPDGGTVAAPFNSPIGAPIGTPGSQSAGVPVIEMIIAPGALADATQITLTPLSPQGLIAPVPLGWSVLLGIDIDFPSPVAISGNGGGSGWGSVSIPLTALGATDPQTITTAVWDDTNHQWLAGPAPTVTSDALEIVLPAPNSQLPSPDLYLAVLVADTTPAAPATPVAGEALQGVEAVQVSADSGGVATDPPVILTGTGGSAFVLTQAHSTTPLPSGTLLQVDLREHYTLRDGSEISGTAATEELPCTLRCLHR